ncbi:Conserved DNA-binding protein YbaB [Lentzea fradiae]|uniref:Conserved DNA-binding protein YbaB n=1 Tax=Lentzea fradiae TaxID=200378 RepID=A0A1G7LE70_9PSEU|nr:YbaB/EbfC family nucleoid-associated protein [Lentzea fradiae]SDF47269.1 Conserved DNA-binding protein YbaB [Lentzea fradiae]
MTDRQERMQSLMRSFEEQAKKAGELQQAMKDLRGVGRSPDGAVTVTAASSGAVLGLRLTPNAVNRSHVQLQQEILDAIRMATQNAAQQLEQAVAPILGDRLQQFKDGMAASGVEPIMPSAPPPPGAQDSAPPPLAPARPPAAPQTTARNRPVRDEVEDEEPPSTYLR